MRVSINQYLVWQLGAINGNNLIWIYWPGNSDPPTGFVKICLYGCERIRKEMDDTLITQPYNTTELPLSI